MKHWYRHFLCVSLFLLITGLLVSCLNPQPQAPVLLEQAKRLMENHPDSAMILIDSIFYPEASLRKPQYMQYLVTRVQARYKNYRPVAEDTLIFAARDYFIAKGKDPRQTTLACFYSGCVYREQEDFDRAMQQYKDAERYAAKTDDVDLQGLVQYNMGDLLAEQGLHAQALEKYKSAENLYRQSPVSPQEKQARCLVAVGQMFLLSEKQDSSFVALHNGLKLAESIHSRELQSLLAHSLSVGYKEAKKYDEAEKYLRQSFALKDDTTETPRYYLNFAKLYFETRQTDSATLYTNRLRQSVEKLDDPYFKASAYAFLAENARGNADYNTAFAYLQKSKDIIVDITEKQLQQSVYEVQQKYDYERQQNLHAHAMLRRQRLGIIFLTLFLAASLTAVALLRKTLWQKNRLLSLRNVVQTLDKTTQDLLQQQPAEESAGQHRDALLWKFDVQQKVMLLKPQLRIFDKIETETALAKFDEVIYGKDNPSVWDALEQTLDEMYPELPAFLRRTHPQFSDTEFKVCLLSYAGLQTKKIALLIKQKTATVNMARTAIRKKMNLSEAGADFCAVLEKAYRQRG